LAADATFANASRLRAEPSPHPDERWHERPTVTSLRFDPLVRVGCSTNLWPSIANTKPAMIDNTLLPFWFPAKKIIAAFDGGR